MGRIVVGIDSSPDAERALAWALEEARLRGAELELVHAYPSRELTALPMIVTLPDDAELRAAAASVLEDALKAVGGAGDVEVILTTRAGGAAGVLTQAAEAAELLVIGARGLGGFRGLLLGSVSQQTVPHSPCPVVVVTRERE